MYDAEWRGSTGSASGDVACHQSSLRISGPWDGIDVGGALEAESLDHAGGSDGDMAQRPVPFTNPLPDYDALRWSALPASLQSLYAAQIDGGHSSDQASISAEPAARWVWFDRINCIRPKGRTQRSLY